MLTSMQCSHCSYTAFGPLLACKMVLYVAAATPLMVWF